MAASLERRRWLTGLVFTAQLLGGCQADQDALLVLTAASCVNAMEDVVRTFESSTGTRTRLSAASSNALAQQILAGVEADIFVSANPDWVDLLSAEGMVKEQTPWLGNRLVLVAPLNAARPPRSATALVNHDIKHVAIAGERVPAGKYAEAALQHAGVLRPLRQSGRIARGEDVRLTLGFVESGEAEAGIVYATDAKASSAVEIVHTFPPGSHPPIRYPLARLSDTTAARSFFLFAQSATAGALTRHHGFLSLGNGS